MNLEEVPTPELVAALATRMDTLLVLGIRFEDGKMTYHRKLEGNNTFAMVAPLINELRYILKSFDDAEEMENPTVTFW